MDGGSNKKNQYTKINWLADSLVTLKMVHACKVENQKMFFISQS